MYKLWSALVLDEVRLGSNFRFGFMKPKYEVNFTPQSRSRSYKVYYVKKIYEVKK